MSDLCDKGPGCKARLMEDKARRRMINVCVFCIEDDGSCKAAVVCKTNHFSNIPPTTVSFPDTVKSKISY